MNLNLPQGIPFIIGNSQIDIGNNVSISKITIAKAPILEKAVFYIGDNTKIKGPATIGPHIDIHIGKNCFVEANSLIITSDGHPYNSKLRRELKPVKKEMLKSIFIDDNVYIGRNVSILKGVTIEKNSIILANSLVIRDIPQNSIACGVPAKVIGKRVTENDTCVNEVND